MRQISEEKPPVDRTTRGIQEQHDKLPPDNPATARERRWQREAAERAANIKRNPHRGY